jgi:ankyrin repeat protein
MELLISQVDLECLSGDSGGRLLLSISRTKNVRAASKLIENGANVNFNIYNMYTRTPLYEAVSSKNPEMVRLPLENGADANIRWPGDTPTAIAVAVWYNPSTEIVDLLIEYGADINCSVYGKDLLNYVSLYNRDIYRFIVDKIGRTIASVTIGDILEAANKGSHPLSEYLRRRHGSKLPPLVFGTPCLRHLAYFYTPYF